MQRDVSLLLDMFLIHHYRGVDLRAIFKAADVEIPRLLAFLEKHLPESPPGE